MYLGQNKSLVRRFIDEVWNTGNISVANQIVSIGYIEHSPLPGQVPGFEGIKQAFRMLWNAFPDLHFKLEDMFAEDHKLVVRGIFQGTHQGTIMGIPPSGELLRIPEIHIFRLASGKILEHWGEFVCPAALQEVYNLQHSLPTISVAVPQFSSAG
jgi:steroid delta-isomerase-like uncharacterized protein